MVFIRIKMRNKEIKKIKQREAMLAFTRRSRLTIVAVSSFQSKEELLSLQRARKNHKKRSRLLTNCKY